MKRTINESQLRTIVAESVKRVLDEIDWKTYANAEEKQRKQPYNKRTWDRADKFRKAKEKAFNDQFGYEDETGFYRAKEDGKPLNTDPYRPMHFHTQARVPKKGLDTSYYDDVIDYGYNIPSYENGYSSDPHGYYNVNDRNIEKYYDKMGDVGKHAKAGNDDIKHYRNGDYEYDNEKGWHLKNQ